MVDAGFSLKMMREDLQEKVDELNLQEKVEDYQLDIKNPVKRVSINMHAKGKKYNRDCPVAVLRYEFNMELIDKGYTLDSNDREAWKIIHTYWEGHDHKGKPSDNKHYVWWRRKNKSGKLNCTRHPYDVDELGYIGSSGKMRSVNWLRDNIETVADYTKSRSVFVLQTYLIMLQGSKK